MNEASELHTRLLRFGLAVEPSAVWWERWRPGVTAAEAYAELWFGAASEARVKVLVANLQARFDDDSVLALRSWSHALSERRWACLWHLMLADPIARGFFGDYLPGRRERGYRDVRREGVVDWVEALAPGRWSRPTRLQFASKLLGAAKQIGWVTGARGPRPLAQPACSDAALAYLLYLLRGSEFTGAIDDNAYLRALGAPLDDLHARLSALPDLSYGRRGDVVRLEFSHPDLLSWARA